MKSNKKIGGLPAQRSPKTKDGMRIRTLLHYYDEGTIGTIQELIKKAESISIPEVQKAITEYRKAMQEDWDLKGRGDMEAVEDKFIRALLQATKGPAEGGKMVEWGKAPLSTGMKSLLDDAISAKRPIDAILASDKVEDGEAIREYLKKAGYVLKDDKYLP